MCWAELARAVDSPAAAGLCCHCFFGQVPEDIYKTHLVEGRAATDTAVDSARSNLAVRADRAPDRPI